MTEQDYVAEKLAGKLLKRTEITPVKESRGYPNGIMVEFRPETFKEWKARKEQEQK